MKIKLYFRLMKNEYTAKITSEWFCVNPHNKFRSEIEEFTEHSKDVHRTGTPFSLEERCQCQIQCLSELDRLNQKDDKNSRRLVKIFQMSDKNKMRAAIELVVHAKNTERGII
jgi:hypothetical protein